MFGISPLGWIHTLGSLPAIPVAVFMFARYGRIVPRSLPGLIYFIAMLIGAVTVFLVAHEPAGYVIGAVTLVLLLAGYGVEHLRWSGACSQIYRNSLPEPDGILADAADGDRGSAPRSGRPPAGDRPEVAAPAWVAGQPSHHSDRRPDGPDRPSAQARQDRRGIIIRRGDQPPQAGQATGGIACQTPCRHAFFAVLGAFIATYARDAGSLRQMLKNKALAAVAHFCLSGGRYLYWI